MIVRFLRGTLAPAVCVAIVAALAGCAGGGASGEQEVACERAGEAREQERVMAVLAQEGVAQPSSGATAALDKVLGVAGEEEARVLFGSSGSAQLEVDTRLVEEGVNDLQREEVLGCRVELVRAGFERIADAAPRDRLDLLSALRNLDASLAVEHGTPVEVVVVGSAVNTVGVDLRKRAIRANPARSINSLAKAGLNFDCKGWRVHIAGGGVTPQGQLPNAVDSQLREWWRRYFDHCGGALVFYASHLTEFPAGEEAVPAADRTLIPVKIERRGGEVEATLSNDVLFAVNSSALLPGASKVLKGLLSDLAASRGAIEVTGYADSTGSDAINLPLSRDRAEAVARWLATEASIAADRIEVDGQGAADPVASNATEAGRAKNRRVTVIMR